MTIMTDTGAASGARAVRTDDLAPGERLLLGLFRRWVTGALSGEAMHWRILWRDLTDRTGTARAEVLVAALEEWLSALARGSARPIAYHPPCCGVVNADEELLLRLVACGQGGDRDAASHELGAALLGAGQVLFGRAGHIRTASRAGADPLYDLAADPATVH